LFQGDNYGIDWDGPAPDMQTTDSPEVVVPFTTNPLQEADFALLKTAIDPLCNSDEYGVDIYLEVLTFCEQHI
jgi:hypothetical protein